MGHINFFHMAHILDHIKKKLINIYIYIYIHTWPLDKIEEQKNKDIIIHVVV